MTTPAWRYQPGKDSSLPGAQIDLLIDRKDGVINICEMKYYDSEFTIDGTYADELRQKIQTFRELTKTRKSIFLVLVTPFGIKRNKYALEMEITDIRLEDLF